MGKFFSQKQQTIKKRLQAGNLENKMGKPHVNWGKKQDEGEIRPVTCICELPHHFSLKVATVVSISTRTLSAFVKSKTLETLKTFDIVRFHGKIPGN